jgi:F-type H+-transporting ATPase subunit gamma
MISKMMAIGRKGFDYFKRKYDVTANYSIPKPVYGEAKEVAQVIIDGFVSGEYDRVVMLYNSFRTVMSQDITFQNLLPIETDQSVEEELMPAEFIYEPSVETLLSELLPKNIEVQIFKAMLESVAGEHGARMTAMDSASRTRPK